MTYWPDAMVKLFSAYPTFVNSPLSAWYMAGFFTAPSAWKITTIPILSAPLSFSISFTSSASRCPNITPSLGKHAGKKKSLTHEAITTSMSARSLKYGSVHFREMV